MIRHILKDGTEVDDIKGMVIKASEHKVLYEIINKIQQKEDSNETVPTPD